jgi:uncharacterized protein YegP (UPF0339 family)
VRRGKYVVFLSDADGNWYWRLVGGNGENQGHSEAYPSESNAKRGAKDAKRTSRFARIVGEE